MLFQARRPMSLMPFSSAAWKLIAGGPRRRPRLEQRISKLFTPTPDYLTNFVFVRPSDNLRVLANSAASVCSAGSVVRYSAASTLFGKPSSA